jgi:hypothetical protein
MEKFNKSEKILDNLNLAVNVEKLKSFRWQIIAGVSVLLWVFEFFKEKIF